MLDPSIVLEKKGAVACITLNRPDKFNSFNRAMSLAMHQALDEAKKDDAIRAVLITGQGKAFCAGQDLGEAIDPEGPGIRRIVAEHYNPIILRIRELEKPVIGAVNGIAAGAGANIALACDITLAARSAGFIQAFSKIGLIPDSGGTFILPRLIGWQRATALMMLGDKVSAEEAVAMGMIYKTCDDDKLAAAAMELANKLAGMPTRGLGLTKRLLNDSFSNNLEAQLQREVLVQAEAGETEDHREGVNAFLEKRPAVFKGR